MIALWLMSLGFSAETVWVTSDVQSLRFPDDDQVQGPFLSAGDEVDLIIEEQGRARVRKVDAYGWIPAAQITREEPSAEALPE